MPICNCPHCQKPIRINEKMTPEKFKKTFKVGDVITCWSTDRPAKITAIGENRILYTCAWEDDRPRPTGVNQIEHVASMFHDWRFLDVKKI